MTRYAEGTTVPVDKTALEIERMLAKRGATQFARGWDGESAVIQFTHGLRRVRFKLPLPQPKDFARDARGYSRTAKQAGDARDKELRRLWRSLLLVMKSKFEAVESGVTSFETEFLPHLVLDDGRTVEDAIVANLQAGIGGLRLLGAGS